MGPKVTVNDTRWTEYFRRYQSGEWRTPIFRDLVLADAEQMTGSLTFLDIGCGRGFDDDPNTSLRLATACSRFEGIEPDTDMQISVPYHEIHRCSLNEAPIQPHSIDIAWSVMVLEHVAEPAAFWKKVHCVLRPGGVFWAFTIDSRHFFTSVVSGMDRVGIKQWYLRRMNNGNQSGSHYEHYPTWYLSNSPRSIARYAHDFTRCDFLNFRRVGQVDAYMPRAARQIVRLFERFRFALRRPGVLLAVRCER